MAKTKTSYRLHYLTNSMPDLFTNQRAASKEYTRAAKIACVWLTKDGKIVKSNTSLKEIAK